MYIPEKYFATLNVPLAATLIGHRQNLWAAGPTNPERPEKILFVFVKTHITDADEADWMRGTLTVNLRTYLKWHERIMNFIHGKEDVFYNLQPMPAEFSNPEPETYNGET